MDIIQLAAIAIIGVVTTVILKSYQSHISLMIVIVLSFLFLWRGMGYLIQIKTELGVLESILRENRNYGSYYKILFKTVGITYLCEFTAGICKDAGYQSISSQIEFMGKIIILVSGMPILVTIVETLWNYQI